MTSVAAGPVSYVAHVEVPATRADRVPPPALRFLERFSLITFALYHLPLYVNNYPSLGGGGFNDTGLAPQWGHVFTPPGIWVARHVFGLTGAMTSAANGDNGDTGEEYGRLLLSVIVALVAALAWFFADRRAPRARWVGETQQVLLRYSIALGLTSYAIAKILPMQFPPLSTFVLEQRVGDLSPMALLWTFMEYSRPYAFFAGALEVVAVVLLCFRRTATLGAIICIAVMANVAAMNLAYGVPVKLYAVMTVVSAAVIVLYDARRLLAVFVKNAAAAPMRTTEYFHRIPSNIRWVIKAALLGSVVASSFLAMREAIAQRAPATPFDGAWVVTSFERDDQSAIADSLRWQRLVVQGPGLSIQLTSGARIFCRQNAPPDFDIKKIQQRDAVQLSLGCSSNVAGDLRATINGSILQLNGTFDRTPMRASARHVDASEYQLLRSKFQLMYDR